MCIESYKRKWNISFTSIFSKANRTKGINFINAYLNKVNSKNSNSRIVKNST